MTGHLRMARLTGDYSMLDPEESRMTGGELLRTYAPHIYQAHLEWAGEDLYGRTPAEIAGIHWLAAKMAEPTCGPTFADMERADAFTDILSPAEQAAAMAGRGLICPECANTDMWERGAALACNTCGANIPIHNRHCVCPSCEGLRSVLTASAMESSPHGGMIGEPEPAKVICAAHKWMRTIFGYDVCSACGASGLSSSANAARQNSYGSISAAPEYTDREKAQGKALGAAIGRL